MPDFDRAVADVYDIINERPGRSDAECFRMYKTTNENLTTIFGQFDFTDKDVLSVLSSSDQLLSSYFLGAKSVDTFDNNLTPYLFYYLKKWCMEYTGKSVLSSSNRELIECLDLHNNTLIEKNVAYFWRRILINIREPLARSALFFNQFHEYSVPYTRDLDKMVGLINDREPNYSKMDMFQEQDIKKKYDVIVLSNILEYAYKEDIDYQVVIDNLLNSLNDDGIVICSNLIFEKALEAGEFDEYFDIHPGAYEYEPYRERYKPISYSYTKKKKS